MPVIIEDLNATTVVRLGWPEVKNALDASRALEIQEAIQETGNKRGCRAIVLASTGSAFCAGGDLPFFVEAAAEEPGHVRSIIETVYQPLVMTIMTSPVPVVAAVDGPAVGLGMDLALSCDVCFMGSSAVFVQGWARVGLIPGAGGLLFGERALGRHEIWQMVAEPADIDSAEAARLGLATKAKSGDAEHAAIEFANSVARLPEMTVRAYKRLLNGLYGGLSDHLRDAAELQAALLTSPAFTERADRMLRRAKAASGRTHSPEGGNR